MITADGPAAWPIGGGEAGRLIREIDWAGNPLGAMDKWPQTLRIKANSIVNSPIPQVLMWGDDAILLYNDGYIEIAGDYHPRALGGRCAEIWPEIWDWNSRILDEGFRGRVQAFREQPLTLNRRGHPEEVVFDLFYTPIYGDDGRRVEGVLCTVLEITEAVRARKALAESRAELKTLTDSLPILVGFLDRDLVYRMANSRYLDLFGKCPEDVVGRPVAEIVGPDYLAMRQPSLDRALAGETVISDAPLTLPDGSRRTFEVRYIPRLDAAGAVLGIYVMMLDIEDRTRTEAKLRDSNARFAAAVDAIHGVLWTTDPQGQMLDDQAGWAKLTGQGVAEYRGLGWIDAVHPDDREATRKGWQRAVVTRATYTAEHRVRGHDGDWRNFAIRAVPICEARGDVREWVGVHTDITEQRAAEAQLVERARDLERQVRHRKRAEEQLRNLNESLEARVEAEIAERRKAESALRQAQKMEAIGQLTGGIAHDFNNLLQVVAGNLQLLGRDVAGVARSEQRVANALAGVARGTKLASQLLAFGRRQPLEPRVIHLGRLVGGMDDLLRRSLGEGVEIEMVTTGGLWNTSADPGQVENVLLNLAINARDAMGGRGRLTIEVANAHLDQAYADAHAEVSAGHYVMLAVTDTGTGMTPDVLDHAFEPFFSTKPEGRGTGLGLSMVYGFVKQSGGHVAIYSEPGQGTTVRVYLPRSMAQEDREIAIPSGPVEKGSETVLVVEDDEEVRHTVVDMLTDLGYRVLTARDPQSGLNVIESGAAIDVLFTDVVMPGPVTSREMARRAQERMPDLAVLFTSGYTENSIVHGGRLDPGVELLSKPYTREALARRLRHVLGNARQAQAQSPRPATPPDAALVSSPGPAQDQSAAALRILLVEDNVLICADTAMMLEDMGHSVLQAGTAAKALALVQDHAIDLLLTDLGLPDMPGNAMSAIVLQHCPDIALVYATGEMGIPPGSPDRAVLLAKPYTEGDLRRALAQAVQRRQVV